MKSSLYHLREMSDVFVDACVRDATGDLMFLSCYGRDTALTQLFAAFSLSPAEGGFRQLTVDDEDGESHTVSTSRAEGYRKLAGRLPKENLFGNLAQVWIYDPVVLEPDRSNRRGWVFYDRARSEAAGGSAADIEQREIDRRIWSMIQRLSPVPLLSHWEQAVRQALGSAVGDTTDGSFPPLGRVAAYEVRLPDEFAGQVSALVKSGAVEIGADRHAATAA